MVGLSIVLETTNNTRNHSDGLLSPKSHHVVNKVAVAVTTVASSAVSELRRGGCYSDSGFLEHCFLCRKKLLQGKDIYMYKGDGAFCSVECRSKQMFMDEEESLRRSDNLDVKTKKSDSPVASPPSYSGGCHRRDPRN
ncbi:unnamed protein product [Cochlearia groenlandica]